jgi:hypothetical protein
LSESLGGGSISANGDRFRAEGGQAAPRREIVAFWRGYEAALATISTGFGLALFEDFLDEEGRPLLKRAALQSSTNGQGRRQNLDDVRGERV